MQQFQVDALKQCYCKEAFTQIEYQVWYVRILPSHRRFLQQGGIQPLQFILQKFGSLFYKTPLDQGKKPLRVQVSQHSPISVRSCVSFHFCGYSIGGIDLHMKFCMYITMQGLHTTHLCCQNFLVKNSITHFANLQVNEMSAISIFPIGSQTLM